ncbi:hypothetical protein HPG69_008139 [Diceros bicornis minor]|uniref:Uncharacterized protein n=1 Tax=Diceros bicornis minor TaxID=77932 RepID=A0A7J7F7X5_DICBM|nr:hypothetical protein HPG69_008139 [Diceros bicornis minor]
MAKTRGQGAFRPSGCVTLLVLQLLSGAIPGNGKADFQLSGPGEPVPALVGEDAVLPCLLSPSISAEDMELRWYRDQPSPAVYVHRKGGDVQEDQMALYQGRTTFVEDLVAQGEAAVRIHNVTAFDNGTFHCWFNDSTGSAEATLWLRVAEAAVAAEVGASLPAGLGSEPGIRVPVDQDKGAWAECTSAGWYPEPQVQWTDFRGKNLPDSVNNVSASRTTGLWAVVSNVTIPDWAVGGLVCSFSSPLLTESKAAGTACLMVPVYSLENSSASDPRDSRSCSIHIHLLLLEASKGPHNAPAVSPCPLRVGPWLYLELPHLLRGRLLAWGPGRKWGNTGIPRAAVPPLPPETWERGPGVPSLPSLDPDTASPKLLLSGDGKSVRRLRFDQELHDDPGRFDLDPCVLGREGFSSGRHYWEVEVGHRVAWTLGVCLESLDRKGRVPKSPQHGLWAVELYKQEFWALSFPRVRLHPLEPLHRVGVLLDCDAGRISFHSAPDRSLIYAFSGLSVSAPLRPFFCLWTHDPRPLTICSGHWLPEASDPPQGQGQEWDGDPPLTRLAQGQVEAKPQIQSSQAALGVGQGPVGQRPQGQFDRENRLDLSVTWERKHSEGMREL